jgi:integrase
MITGSLQKKDNSPYYQAVLSYKDENGKRKQEWVSTKKKAQREAKLFLENLLHDRRRGQYSPTKLLFIDFLKDWLNNVIKCQVEQTTFDGYTTNITKHIIPYFLPKQIKLANLKTIDLQGYFNEKQRQGDLSPSTLKKHYVNINKALEYAVDMEFIYRNPAKKIQLPKIKRYEPKLINDEQAKKLMEACKGTIIETAVFLGIYLGLRRGEVLGLRWKDIDFNLKTLFVQNNRTKVTVKVEKKPKSKASERHLRLAESLVQYLKRLKARQKEDQLRFGEAYQKNDYVCKYEDGTPLKETTLNHAFKRILRDSDLPDIRFHDLRHSTASLLHASGATPKDLQEWLGHSDISTTMDIYVHVLKDADKGIAERMNNLIIGL